MPSGSFLISSICYEKFRNLQNSQLVKIRPKNEQKNLKIDNKDDVEGMAWILCKVSCEMRRLHKQVMSISQFRFSRK